MVRRTRVSDGAAIEVVSLEFGAFPEITRLNPRFVAGHQRLKLTLDVKLPARPADVNPPAFVEALKDMLPSLARHRCCGDNQIHETFFTRARRRACAIRETDETVDVAHLLEHLVIDFQHYIADMRICSGVTCGYESPRHRYDIFIESPGQNVSHLCVEVARALMKDLLRGGPPDPIYARVVKLAHQFHQNPGRPISPPAAAGVLGDGPRTAEALHILREMNFIREIETSINFSRVPLYQLERRGMRRRQALDLDSA